MLKQIILTAALAMTAAGASAQQADPNFAVKAYGDFNLTRAYSAKSSHDCVKTSAMSTCDFGVDFGWTFFRFETWRLSANIGLSVTPGRQRFALKGAEFSYEAGPEADIDSRPYTRYVTTSAITQELKTLHVGVPLYIDAEVSVHRIVSLYGQLGYRSLFNASTTSGSVRGTVTSAGLYPQYADLLIDAPIMNEFGRTDLTPEMSARVKGKTYVPELMAGLGVRVNVWQPLWVELGFNYRYSGNLYDCKGLKCPSGATAEQLSPVTYTIADGLRAKSPTAYLASNRINTLQLSLALIYRF